ncbi:hypothetical protein CWS02_14775 [Enterobacter sp. EA-1]|nr:hypothetical protein CWS02_14775 [Enterobacter sp. EA-1]
MHPDLFLFIISCIVLATCYFKLLPHTMIGALSIIMPMGIALSFLGRVCPVAKDIGGPAIFCLMVPSLMVWANVFGNCRYGEKFYEGFQLLILSHRLAGRRQYSGDESSDFNSGNYANVYPAGGGKH